MTTQPEMGQIEADRIADLPDVIADIAAQVRALSAKAHALELVLQRPDLLVKLLHIDIDVDATPGTMKASLGAQPSELALELLAALRTGNSDLLIVEHAFGHLAFSSAGFDDQGEPRPAESHKRGHGGADGGAA